MPDPIKKQPISEVDQVFNQIGPVKINKNAQSAVYNSTYAQGFEDLPFNNNTLQNGVLTDLGYTSEGYGGQFAKHVGAALINTAGFAAATLAAIPNFIDNQFNEGNDRIMKPINELQNSAMDEVSIIQNPNTENQSIMSYMTPGFISGHTKSFWSDVIEQSGIIAGTTIGTGALLGAARFIPGLAAAETALGSVVKSALSNAIKPTTLLAENLGISKGIANTINTQKFLNGLASAAKTSGLNAVQSYTEALFEGLDGERNFVDSKIREYEEKYGYTPDGKELDDIKKTGEQLKEMQFGLNMAGLMISNTSFTKAFFGGESKGWISRLDNMGKTLSKEGTLINKELSFLKNAPTYISKPINYIAAKMPLAYSEGLEEVYQLGVEKGLDNYYSNKLNTENFEANFSNIAKSIGVGLNEGVFSKEGLKSFITGAGVGSIFQGYHTFKENRSLNKYLDETKTYIDPETKEEITTTNRQDLVKNLTEIDKNIAENYTGNPLESNPVSLNQTLGDRIQQFVTDNNNHEDSIKVQGSYLEYDQAQKTKFDSLLPYIKKGYKDVIVSKIEGAFHDLNKDNLSEEQKRNLQLNKQIALEDVNTVEKFSQTIDNVFYENYGHPILDAAQRQLKDVAVFHLWNIHSLNKQKEELIDAYGDNIFQDEVAKGFTGENINAILDKELSKVKPLTEDIDPYKQERAILEKIKTSENPVEAYFAYKQKDKEGTFLTSTDFLILKKQREALDKRIFENNSVFQNLQNVKTNPAKALAFMKEYHGKAQTIVKKTEQKAKEVEQKAENKEKIEKIVLPKDVEKVIEKLEPVLTKPITTTDIKEAAEEVKKEEFKPSVMVKKTTEELIADIEKRRKEELSKEFSNVGLVKTTVESSSDSVLQRQGLEWKKTWYGPQRVPVSDIVKSYNEINAKYDKEVSALTGKEPLSKLEKSTTLPKPKRLRNELEDEASSLTSSKIFSMFTTSTSVEKEVKEIIDEMESHTSDIERLKDEAFVTGQTVDELKQDIIDHYNKEIAKVKAAANTAQSQRELLGTTDGATITSETLQDAESNLYYDVGLIRTQNYSGNKQIYTVNFKNLAGELIPAFTVQNNAQNFQIDAKLLEEFVNEHKTELDKITGQYQVFDFNGNESFVDFLENLLIQEGTIGEEIFKYIQNKTFTLKSDVEHSNSISQAGSKLKLFNFKFETLSSLYNKLKGENIVYDLLTKGASFEDIAPFLKIEFLNSNSLQLPGYDITTKESGAEGLIKIEGDKIYRNNTLLSSDIDTFRNQNLKNLRDGFYALFKTSRGTFFPVGVRTSMNYTDLSEAGKNSFTLALYYGKDKDDFYSVDRQVDGSHIVSNKSTKETKTYDNFDTFAKWAEEERVAKNANISYLETGADILNLLFDKSKVNYKVFKNNSVKVDFILPQNIEDNILEEKTMKPKETNLNQILEVVPETDFNIEITKKGQTTILNRNVVLYNISYTLKPGVTEEQLKEAISNSKKKTSNLIQQEILTEFYDAGTPSYSSISEYQLNKIKEFTEQCQ